VRVIEKVKAVYFSHEIYKRQTETGSIISLQTLVAVIQQLFGAV
jgi:hypothetical protein